MPAKPNYPIWLSLSNIIGIAIGLIMAVIGLVMAVNTTIKLYVFDFDINSHFDPSYQCNIQYDQERHVPARAYQRHADETMDQCIQRITATEKLSHRRHQLEDIIDGLVLFFVGLPIWLFHFLRNRHLRP